MRIACLLLLGFALTACGSRATMDEVYDAVLVRWLGVGSVSAQRLADAEDAAVAGDAGARVKLGKAAADLSRMTMHYREAHWELTRGERRFADAWNAYVRDSVARAKALQARGGTSVPSAEAARRRMLDVAAHDDDARDLLARVNREYPRGLLAR